MVDEFVNECLKYKYEIGEVLIILYILFWFFLIFVIFFLFCKCSKKGKLKGKKRWMIVFIENVSREIIDL